MSGSGTRRTSILKRRASKTARVIYYAKRTGIVVLLLAGVGFSVRATLNSGWLTHAEVSTVESFHEKTVAAGFEVKDLMIDGRVYTGRDELKSAIGVMRHNSIFAYDLAQIHERVAALPWVKSAIVERRLPDTIYVRLFERQPVAIWQKDGKAVLVDSEGAVLTDKNLKSFADMIVVTGENAPHNAPQLMTILQAEKDLKDRIEIARWIGDRRWDIKLKNGITLRLPEEDMELAIKRLGDAQKAEKVMDRKLESIDLRDPLRMVIQTAPGAVQKYEADYKREKNI